jgi:hypothetical protein
MTFDDACALRHDLLKLFGHYGVQVAVGLTKDGVAIRSQDKQVNASSIGTVKAQEVQDEDAIR